MQNLDCRFWHLHHCSSKISWKYCKKETEEEGKKKNQVKIPTFITCTSLSGKLPQTWKDILVSCPQQLNRWPRPLLGRAPLTIREFTTLQSDPRDSWPLRHVLWQFLWQFFMTIFHDNFSWQFLMTIFDENFWCNVLWQFLMTIFDDNFWWQFFMTIFHDNYLWQFLMTCDIWDTDYNTDNWEPGFMTIFVTWQLIVTLDSIRNSCDVLPHKCEYWLERGRLLLTSSLKWSFWPILKPISLEAQSIMHYRMPATKIMWLFGNFYSNVALKTRKLQIYLGSPNFIKIFGPFKNNPNSFADPGYDNRSPQFFSHPFRSLFKLHLIATKLDLS